MREMRRKDSKDRSAMIVAAVAIILIIIVGVTAGQREQITIIEKWIGNLLSPVQSVVNTGVNVVGEGFRSIFSVGKIKEENENLKNEIEVLRREVITYRLQRDELEELRGLKYALNYVEDEVQMDTLAARVIGKNPGIWFDIFTINVGEKDGVTTESIVLTSEGLVGRVYETGGNWAKVVSIVDNNSSVSFQILRDANAQGVLSGSVNYELSGYLFDTDAEVVVGDRLITSGLGIYPKGIPIGEVVDVSRTPDNLLKTVTVAPGVNFNHMSTVMVLTPRGTSMSEIQE